MNIFHDLVRIGDPFDSRGSAHHNRGETPLAGKVAIGIALLGVLAFFIAVLL